MDKQEIKERQLKSLEKSVMDSWVHLRTTNQSIPDDDLDWMRDLCLLEIKKMRYTYEYGMFYVINPDK